MAFGIANGTTVKIDKAGRIVRPEAIRQRLRFRDGSELRLLETENGVTLLPLRQQPSMVLKDGIWVHLGKLPPGLSWETLVEDAREERMLYKWTWPRRGILGAYSNSVQTTGSSRGSLAVPFG